MSRAIVTFATGPHEEMLELALPSFRAYGAEHGYEVLIASPMAWTRPASWMKVQVLRAALAEHDEVLWLDADVVIVDGSADIAEQVRADRWQGLAVHETRFDGRHPNHGVWFVRRPMLPVLEQIWGMRQYLHHPWWEQAASLELLGYDPNARPVVLRKPTPLLVERTQLLSDEWNALPDADVRKPRFRHAASRPDRLELMKGWADARVAA